MLNENIPLHTFPIREKHAIPFYVTAYEHPASKANYPHRHDFFEIHYITSGKGTHFIDFEAYPVEPHNIYFVSPGQVHFWELTKDIQGRALLFTEDLLMLESGKSNLINELSFFHNLEKSPRLRLETTKSSPLLEIISKLEQEQKNPMFSQASVIRAYLHIFLIEVQRHFVPPEEKSKHDAFVYSRRFKQLVVMNFVHERSVEAYAKMLNVSTAHLHDTVRTTTGLTPGQIIRQEITLEAKRLLTHTKLTSAEVGYKLAFDDPAYFGRFFKREVGLSPSSFRKSIREKYQLFQ